MLFQVFPFSLQQHVGHCSRAVHRHRSPLSSVKVPSSAGCFKLLSSRALRMRHHRIPGRPQGLPSQLYSKIPFSFDPKERLRWCPADAMQISTAAAASSGRSAVGPRIIDLQQNKVEKLCLMVDNLLFAHNKYSTPELPFTRHSAELQGSRMTDALANMGCKQHVAPCRAVSWQGLSLDV